MELSSSIILRVSSVTVSFPSYSTKPCCELGGGRERGGCERYVRRPCHKSNIESLTIKKVPCFSSLRICTSSTPSPPPRSDVVAVTELIWEAITKQNDAVAATKVVALRSCTMEVFFV